MTATLQAIASTTSKLRALLQETRKDLERIQVLQTALTETLDGFFEASDGGDGVKSPASVLATDGKLWNETLSLVATGRVLGLAAQAEDALSASSTHVRERTWTADGKKYAQWLAKGVVKINATADQTASRQLLGKTMGMGYADETVSVLSESMLFQSSREKDYFELVAGLSTWEQRHFLTALMSYLEVKLSSTTSSASSQQPGEATNGAKSTQEIYRIAGAAALLQQLLAESISLQEHLVEQLIKKSFSTVLVRASLAALPLEQLRTLMERSWNQFGDKLCIKHKPIVQQENNARLLLLSAGRVHRSKPMDVFVMARSSHYGSAISERLSSSSNRIRWLGMIVGTAISRLVDKDGMKMDFKVEEMNTNEAEEYLLLTSIDDKSGEVRDLVDIKPATQSSTAATGATLPARPVKNTITSSTNAKPRIIEVLSSNEEDDDLAPYSKPDSDASDSEEDATLVERNAPKAPVYIRTLLNMLNDTENFSAQELALTTAPSLIRRKADFGSELKDLADDLASAFLSMQDTFDIENWNDLRQNALVALVTAQPKIVGPWLARTFFTGDYSIAQRAVVLTSIGLGGRELAGFGAENNSLVLLQKDQDTRSTFPSKRLPDRLHGVYGGSIDQAADTKQVDTISRHMEQALLRPVATKQSQRPQKRMLRNDLAMLVGTCFFFPLTGGWASFASTAAGSSRSSLSDPTLLSLFVKTLAILLSAAGQASTSLDQMIAELWTLLLSLRTRAMKHQPLMEAMLFALLTILDMSDGKRVAETRGKMLVETREWVGGVWEKLEDEGGGLKGLSGNKTASGIGDSESGDGEVERCKYLAAGVLVKIKEIVDLYQRVMAGDLASI